MLLLLLNAMRRAHHGGRAGNGGQLILGDGLQHKKGSRQ